MAITLRTASHDSATTKGSPLTHAELDANFTSLLDSGGSSLVGFIQSVTGAGTETVAVALQRLPHTAQYNSAANFATALNALTGTQGLSPKVQLGWTTGEPLTIGRETNVYNGTNDEVCIFGYNVAQDGNSIPDATESSVGLFMESDYNDGTTRYAEVHFNIADVGGSYKRPFFASMALSGANDGLITETFLLSDVVISFYGPLVQINAAASITTGAQLSFFTSDTGGKDWRIFSSGTAFGFGAGHLGFYNNTNSRLGLILDGSGNVVAGNTAAIATDATDGFLYVPTCAGTPTGTPTSYTGKAPIVINTTNNKLYFYSGGAWRDAGP